MIRCCRAVAIGAALGVVVALVGGYLVLMYGPDTLVSL